MSQPISSSGPSLAHLADGTGKELRWIRVLGIVHYVQAALAVLVVALAGWFSFDTWNWFKNLPDTVEYENVGYGVGFMLIGLSFLGGCAALFAPISFLIGNRLMRRRWRIFAIVLAVCESLLALLPLSICIMLSSNGYLVVGVPFIIPIALGVLTTLSLSQPAVRVVFASRKQ
jgi:hypothetical protein